MKWITRNGMSLCAPYRIIRTTQHFEAWIFGPKQAGCLGRGMATLLEARALCEAHKAKGTA